MFSNQFVNAGTFVLTNNAAATVNYFVVNGLANTKVFHASTVLQGNEVMTNGGRVLGVTAWGRDLPTAQAAAYLAVGKIHFDGAQFRRDIAAKAL